MKIEFNPDALSKTEARLIASLLITTMGESVFEGLLPTTANVTVQNVVHKGVDTPPPPPPAVTETKGEPEDEGHDDGAEIDSRGFPWDARIHASTKTKLKSGPTAGAWKPLRGVDENLVKQVEAEYLAQRGTATQAPAVTETAAPPPPPPAAAETKAPPPPPRSEQLIQAAAAGAAANPFLTAMRRVTALQQAGILTEEVKAEFLAAVGLESLAKGASNPTAMEGFIALLDASFPEA